MSKKSTFFFVLFFACVLGSTLESYSQNSTRSQRWALKAILGGGTIPKPAQSIFEFDNGSRFFSSFDLQANQPFSIAIDYFTEGENILEFEINRLDGESEFVNLSNIGIVRTLQERKNSFGIRAEYAHYVLRNLLSENAKFYIGLGVDSYFLENRLGDFGRKIREYDFRSRLFGYHFHLNPRIVIPTKRNFEFDAGVSLLLFRYEYRIQESTVLELPAVTQSDSLYESKDFLSLTAVRIGFVVFINRKMPKKEE